MLSGAITVALVLLGLSLALTLVRVLLGPDLTDRIVALDTLYINAAAMLVLYGLELGTGRYYEAALLIAMLGFITTVVLSKFLTRGDVIE
ncbi:MAG: K+/H+ antiporter subunit F [Steroidobacteraceae bacterium]|nr:K+/H+ antiporter subunit F [Steroidobacteraceae bacterium]